MEVSILLGVSPLFRWMVFFKGKIRYLKKMDEIDPHFMETPTWAIKNNPIPSHYTSWLIGFPTMGYHNPQ